MCGKNKKVSNHHIIPKCFKPKNNRTIPLCKKCHKMIHFHNPDEVQRQLNDIISGNPRLIKLIGYMKDNHNLTIANRRLRNKTRRLEKQVNIWKEHNKLEHNKTIGRF